MLVKMRSFRELKNDTQPKTKNFIFFTKYVCCLYSPSEKTHIFNKTDIFGAK